MSLRNIYSYLIFVVLVALATSCNSSKKCGCPAIGLKASPAMEICQTDMATELEEV